MKLEYRDKKMWLVKELEYLLNSVEFVIFCHENSIMKLNKIEQFRDKLGVEGIKFKFIRSGTMSEYYKKKVGSFTIVYNENGKKNAIDILKMLDGSELNALYVCDKGIYLSLNEVQINKEYKNKVKMMNMLGRYIHIVMRMSVKLNLDIIGGMEKIWRQ
jgi:hypothetical protein